MRRRLTGMVNVQKLHATRQLLCFSLLKAASPSQQKAALAGQFLRAIRRCDCSVARVGRQAHPRRIKPRRRPRQLCRCRRQKRQKRQKTRHRLCFEASQARAPRRCPAQAPKSQKKAEPESSEPKKKPGRKPKQEAQAEEPSKRAAEEPAPEERSKKKTKTTAVDVHLEALRSLKTEAEREEYLGNITLTMRMKVAEAQSMCADALPAAEVEEEAPAPSEKPKEKKRGKAAKPEAALPEPDEAAEAPAPSGRPQKRAAAQQAEPEEVKKPKKLTAAVEKHMDELAKLKTQKQKEKYIAKLTISMQTKVAAALSEAEVQEETEEPESKKRAAPAKEPKDSAKDPPRFDFPRCGMRFSLHDSSQARKVDDSEKHVEELSKLKSEKAKTAYLKQLPSAQLCHS